MTCVVRRFSVDATFELKARTCDQAFAPAHADAVAQIAIAIVQSSQLGIEAARFIDDVRSPRRCLACSDAGGQSLPGNIVAVGIDLRRQTPAVADAVVQAKRKTRAVGAAVGLVQFALPVPGAFKPFKANAATQAPGGSGVSIGAARYLVVKRAPFVSAKPRRC